MPLYEYECEQCGHRFELIRKFSDPPLEACPKCGGPIRKLMSSPAIQFKGTGWYITDYAKKDQVAPSKTGEQKTGDAHAAEAKADAKSDAKGDAKAEPKTESKSSDTKSETKPGT